MRRTLVKYRSGWYEAETGVVRRKKKKQGLERLRGKMSDSMEGKELCTLLKREILQAEKSRRKGNEKSQGN
jgi:hypothetical protein